MAEGGHQMTVMLSSGSVQKFSSSRKNLWPRLFLTHRHLKGWGQKPVTPIRGVKL